MGLINSELRTGIMRELAVQSTIDPVTEVRRRVDFLKDYLTSTPASGYVLGISGGQDSTLTGKLCQQAAAELRARLALPLSLSSGDRYAAGAYPIRTNEHTRSRAAGASS